MNINLQTLNLNKTDNSRQKNSSSLPTSSKGEESFSSFLSPSSESLSSSPPLSSPTKGEEDNRPHQKKEDQENKELSGVENAVSVLMVTPPEAIIIPPVPLILEGTKVEGPEVTENTIAPVQASRGNSLWLPSEIPVVNVNKEIPVIDQTKNISAKAESVKEEGAKAEGTEVMDKEAKENTTAPVQASRGNSLWLPSEIPAVNMSKENLVIDQAINTGTKAEGVVVTDKENKLAGLNHELPFQSKGEVSDNGLVIQNQSGLSNEQSSLFFSGQGFESGKKDGGSRYFIAQEGKREVGAQIEKQEIKDLSLNGKLFVHQPENNITKNNSLSKEIGTESINREDIFKQIIDKAVFTLKKDSSEIKIDLKPDNLGSLKIEIEVKNNMVRANITVESPIVKGVIEENLARLKENFARSGLEIKEFSVKVGEDSQTGLFGGNREFLWERPNNFRSAGEKTYIKNVEPGAEVYAGINEQTRQREINFFA